MTTCLRIVNRGIEDINQGWRLYFSLGLQPLSTEQRVSRTLIDGRYGYLSPGEHWSPLPPNGHVDIPVEPWLFAGMPLVARQGFHIALANEHEETLLGTPELLPPVLAPLTPGTKPWIQALSPKTRYTRNAPPIETAPQRVIPQAKSFSPLNDIVSFRAINISASAVDSETRYLQVALHEAGVVVSPTENGLPLTMTLDDRDADAYQITVDNNGIALIGGSGRALFYAIQSLLQLITQKSDQTFELPAIVIKDHPDFAYRGLFLDIARHFQDVGQLQKILRAMARYKLTHLQLGISNDEAWRLEIPSVPELTEKGATRGYGPETLVPAWGDNHEIYSGFLSRNDFIALLKFAAERHITIVPEFNLPGHANALLRSLDGVDRWQLTDPEDLSTYRSAQGYSGNVMNVGCEDSYQLAALIVSEIKTCYDEAGLPMTDLHLGGDEVPPGAWLRSPACHRLPVWDQNWDIANTTDAEQATSALMHYHFTRMHALVTEISPGTRTGFWHEMAEHGDQTSRYFVWLTEAGDRAPLDKITARNQTFVIANASYLYLDMPYEMSVEEPGLPWATYVDTEAIYHFDPLESWDLSEQEAGQIDGLQAQLWSETVFSAALMDYYLFPRLIAVAERAWNRTPIADHWPDFYAALNNRECGWLESAGIHYRPLEKQTA